MHVVLSKCSQAYELRSGKYKWRIGVACKNLKTVVVKRIDHVVLNVDVSFVVMQRSRWDSIIIWG